MNRKTAESIHGSPIHPMHLSLFIRHDEKGVDGIEHRSEILVFRFLPQSGFPKFIHHFVNLLSKIPLFSPQMIQRILKREVTGADSLNQLAHPLIALMIE